MDEMQPMIINQGPVENQIGVNYGPIHIHRDGTKQPTISPYIWNIPYPRNPYFTGREDILERLHEMLTNTKATALTQRQAISGLGGIGKTQIAIEYAYRHRQEYLQIVWVTAATRESIISSFLEYAALFELPQSRKGDKTSIIATVKHWFITHDHWLVIFDNADDLSLVEEFIPTSDTGCILLTTRDQAPGRLANSLNIETFDKHEGILLLLRRAKLLPIDTLIEQAKAEDLIQAELIVTAMDGLPLAIDQAAAYIEETGCNLAFYFEQYQRHQANLLNRRGRTSRDHPLPVATTWSLSFTHVQHESPLAADLLRLCAFLAPDNIAEEILLEWVAELSSLPPILKDNQANLNEAIGELRQFSLVQRSRSDRTLSIHRLVQAVLQLDMDELTRKTWAEQAIRAVCRAFPNANYTNLQQCERIFTHVLACEILVKSYALSSSEIPLLLIRAGYYLKQIGQYEEAEPFLKRALALYEQVLGPEHPETATCLNNLAVLYRKQEKYDKAEALYRRVLLIREQVLGPEHPETATCLNNLAVLYFNQEKYEEAVALYQRASAISKLVLSPEQPISQIVHMNYNILRMVM